MIEQKNQAKPRVRTSTYTEGRRCVAFALCQQGADGHLAFDLSAEGQYLLFQTLGEAQGFLAHHPRYKEGHIVPVFLTLPFLASGSPVRGEVWLCACREHHRHRELP